jgi:threonine dehydratase
VNKSPHQPPSIEEIRAAHDRIGSLIHRTPVVTCQSLNRISGAHLFLKCENLQKVGAFKARGATNAVFSLSEEEASRGVATHSSGNHAAALSWAARQRGITAHVVMPSSAPPVKKRAVEGYGGLVTMCQPTLAARESTLKKVTERTGATFIHPYDNPVIIAGQGTAAVELLEEHPDLDVVVPPVGGGGLASGTTIAVRALAPDAELIGAEPAEADDAFRSLQENRLLPSEDPTTVADGLRTALSPLTFGILKSNGIEILTAGEQTIIDATRLIWERAKIVVEPSAATTLAIVLEHPGRFRGRRVGLILSGGNVDLDHLPWISM